MLLPPLLRPTLVSLAVVPVLVGGAFWASLSKGGSPADRQTWASAPPSEPFAARALSASLPEGWSNKVVTLPNGYDAISWDQAGDLGFWEQRGTAGWIRAESCRYPIIAPGQALNILSVSGKLLSPMKNATFIISGYFTGDTSGDFTAFAKAGGRWGPVMKTGADESVVACSLNHFVQSQHRAESFAGNDLVTIDATTARAYPSVTNWRWSGKAFALERTNDFPAQVFRSVPQVQMRGTPCHPAPDYGRGHVYDVYLQAETALSAWGTTGLRVLIGLRANQWQCYMDIPITAPLLLPAVARNGHRSINTWVSEPAWLLTQGGEPGALDDLSVPAGYRIVQGAGEPVPLVGQPSRAPSPVHVHMTYDDGVMPTIEIVPPK